MVASFSYNAGSNTVTVTGSTTTLMDDWVAADIAGSWGKIGKLGTSLYLVSCKLIGGDGATPTNVSDKNKQIVFVDGIVTGDNQFLLKAIDNATLTFGVAGDAAAKTSANGCLLLSLEADNYLSFIMNTGTGIIISILAKYNLRLQRHLFGRLAPGTAILSTKLTPMT